MGEDTFINYSDDFIMEFYFRFPAARIQYEYSVRKMVGLIRGIPRSVVDFGCGNGTLLSGIGNKVKGDLQGLDVSEGMINLARKTYPDYSFKVGSVYESGLEDNSMDLIVSRAVMQHLEEPEKFVREIGRVLKPGGQYIVLLPVFSWMGWLPRKMAALLLKKPDEVRGNEYRTQEVVRLFSAGPLTVTDRKYFGGPFYMFSGYGTGVKCPVQNRGVWKFLVGIDNLLLSIPLFPSFGLNFIISGNKPA